MSALQDAVAAPQAGEDPNYASASLAWAHGRGGNSAKARAILERLVANKARPVSPMVLARIYAGLDDRDNAMAQLERAYEQRIPQMPFVGIVFARDRVAKDPRFRDLLKRMKLDVYFPEVAGT